MQMQDIIYRHFKELSDFYRKSIYNLRNFSLFRDHFQSKTSIDFSFKELLKYYLKNNYVHI